MLAIVLNYVNLKTKQTKHRNQALPTEVNPIQCDNVVGRSNCKSEIFIVLVYVYYVYIKN